MQKAVLGFAGLCTLIIPICSLFGIGVVGVAGQEAGAIWKVVGVLLYLTAVYGGYKAAKADVEIKPVGGYILMSIVSLLLSYGAFVGFNYPYWLN